MSRTPFVTLLAGLVLAGPARAQYFGQNKVQYRHLDFAVIETAHFDIYYYEDERLAALDGARMAERAYARLSRVLNHRYRERQPIILFASHSEFQQNNVTNISETTGGVTEPFRHRVLLPFTGSYAEFEHVLQHEIVHQFQFDIFARGRVGGGIQRLVSVSPPLWFMEGMAEYLSIGPIDPQTAMWLRDAALEGNLPDLERLTYDPRVSPYRFGHALWSYVGERWGDEAVGQILHAAAVSGVERAFQRTLGITLPDLVEEWRDAIQRTYLPQIAHFRQARALARPVLTRRTTGASYHLSPAISPDGTEIAYLSEGKSFFIDLYLADAETGRVKRRLVKSAFSSDFESLRFLNSSSAWSADGRHLAIAVKRGGRDDLVIMDARRGRIVRRLELPLHGVTNASWSPDGTQLAFTGYDGGLSDLFLVNADGTDLRRLTHDRYADLQPAWSPDGRAIAFATDRGPQSDLASLELGPLSIALYRLDSQLIERLPGMSGQNTDPQWSPDGRALAFVSDRSGIPNIFLYDVDRAAVFQLTDVFTGVAGITPLSPTLTWARDADRLLFTYYEDGGFNVYAIDDPRSLAHRPYDEAAPKPVVASLTTQPAGPLAAAPSAGGAAAAAGGADETAATAQSYYRSGATLRLSAGTPPPPDSAPPERISVRALLDSATLALPDSLDFSFRDYSAGLAPDYVAQPTIGYVRDNFGNGIFGGSAIALSDMLGNRRVLVAGQVNGRVEEAQVLAVYANLARRTNWAVGASQTPYFFFTESAFDQDSLGNPTFTTTLQRYVVRDAFAQAVYPFSRFRRVELSVRAVNVDRAALDFTQVYDPTVDGYRIYREVTSLGATNYVQPSLAAVFDNSVSLWVGPFMGRRHRFEYAPAIGDWRFHQILADYRRYDHLGGLFTFATRLFFFGRYGRDSDAFPIFLGVPELLRGYTAGSLRDDECQRDASGPLTGCGALDQLIGSRLAVVNAELRFPLTRNVALGFAPIGLPPIEAALFFDAGAAWNDDSDFVWRREPGANKALVRQPLASWGVSIRANLLGFVIVRADYAKPLHREGHGAYWTVSLGPTF